MIEKPAPPRVTVAMAAATIADDCGPGTPHAPPPALPDSVDPKSVEPTWSKGDRAMDDVESKAKRRCEQTSMQLSITTTSGAAVSVKVKRVEPTARSTGSRSSSVRARTTGSRPSSTRSTRW